MAVDRRALWLIPLSVVLLTVGPVAASAQTPPPPPVQPPIQRLVPPTQPKVSPGLAAPAPSPQVSPQAGPSMRITSVAFSGVHAYGEAALRSLVGNLLGPAVPAGAVEDARRKIVDQYRADGYVYTAVSAQIDSSTGVLTFAATEGYVAEIRLAGDKGPFATQVLRFLDHLLDPSERPLRTTRLERWLLLASDIPGVGVSSVLRAAGGDQPGGLTLIATLTHTTISGLVTADNRAYQFTGPNEGLVLFDVNSLTSFGEKTELSLFNSLFDDEQIFGQASSEWFIGGSGLKLKIYAGAGDNQPGGSFKNENFNGFTTIFGSQLSYPLIRERQQTLNISGNFDALESVIHNDTNGPNTRASYDSVRVLRVGADYVWYDLWAGASRSATNAISFKISQGLHTLGASRNGSIDAPRVGERTDLFKVNFDLARTQTLFALWPAATLSLRTAVSGQYSPDILPPAEEFFLGGAHFNRGYYQGQVTGDTAVTGTVELLLDTPIALPANWQLNPTAQFYSFFDVGNAWNHEPGQENVTLRSAGLGVRFYPTGTPQYEVDLEGAQRLNLFPSGSGAGISALKGQAVYWMFLARF